MNKLRAAWFAVRYGEWHAGWDEYEKEDGFLSWTHIYYDGHHRYARIGKFWFGVSY